MAGKRHPILSRDESDILVAIGKLETKFDGMSIDLGEARVEIKEITTGVNSRLANIESNAVSKIVVDQLELRVDKALAEKEVQLDRLKTIVYADISILRTKIDDLETSRTVFRSNVKTWMWIAGVAQAIGLLFLNYWLK